MQTIRMTISTQLAAVALTAAVSHAAVVITPQSSTGTVHSSTAWASLKSTTDLINAGQSTFSSATVSPTFAFPARGLNDGTSANAGTTDNTFFHVDSGNFPATATFDLNIAVHTLGYDITSMQSFMGWSTVSMAQGNQTYTVAVSAVGSAAYTDIATVAYTPFADVSGTDYDSHVLITDSTGTLATGVDSIRFTFLDPLLSVTPGGGGFPGTLVRELDVFGTAATVPEPSAMMLGLLSPALLLGRRRR